jgi:hypothetical protein
MIDRVFKDSDGHWAIWQWPNIPLYGWLGCKLLSIAIPQHKLQTGLSELSTAILFTWAFLELTSGVNYFRRALGLVVLAAVIAGYFMK